MLSALLAQADVSDTTLFILALVAFICFVIHAVLDFMGRAVTHLLISAGGAVGFLALVLNWWPE